MALKVEQATAQGLHVLMCVGETLEEREAGKTDEVCAKQVRAIATKVKDWSLVSIAQEPVWAIGTGKVASPEQAQDAHAAIRTVLKEFGGENACIMQGGSVSLANCEELITKPDIDGFLIGGVSLKPDFVKVVEHVDNYCNKL